LPFEQVGVALGGALQALPHAPQCCTFVESATHAPLQFTSGLLQLRTQVPPEQTAEPLQALPHAPQCAGSLWVLTHCPLHSDWPAAHETVQDPAVQVGVPPDAVHWLPHDPQLSASVFVSTHAPLHSVKPLWQVRAHAPPAHAG
jgi:hypothetical protein